MADQEQNQPDSDPGVNPGIDPDQLALPQGDEMQAMQDQINELQQQIAKLVKTGSAVEAKEVEIPSMRPSLPDHKQAFVCDWQITFTGPQADRYVRPIKVDAISGSSAWARVIKELELDPHKHVCTNCVAEQGLSVVKPKKGHAVDGLPIKMRLPPDRAKEVVAERFRVDPENLVAQVA